MVSTTTESEDSESMEEQRTPKIPAWDMPDVPTGSSRRISNFIGPASSALLTSQLIMQFEVSRNNFSVEVIRLTEDDMGFDMIGIDASLANAFRRILIAELPTMAIEKVLVANNISVIQDEVLAHRLGLIPLKVDLGCLNICQVALLQDIIDEKAEELAKKCPVKYLTLKISVKKKTTVARPRSCTLCRECIRGEDWDKYVSLRRVKDHFIFTIESTGALPPEELFIEAVKILEDRCMPVISELSLLL